MSADPPPFQSAIDARWSVPGDARASLAGAIARELHQHDEPTFQSATWTRLRELDAREGFTTRLAARGVLRRPSDGRFLIFRYPFRDGSWRFVLPGGGADDAETPIEALQREVLEETSTNAYDLQPSGLVLYHLLASTLHGKQQRPTVQYSPVLIGRIANELPDTDGREAHWFSIDEFEAQPRRPISDPLLKLLRAGERSEPIEPLAVWLPA